MYLFTQIKEECTGCKACADVCPQNSISFVEDKEHFLYPLIDDEKCISCNMCAKVCPNEKNFFYNSEKCKVFVGKHRLEEVVCLSSSGGAFTALYKSLCQKNYFVYGVKWTEDFRVIHDCAINEKECESFRKSKYVISDINHSYKKIEKQLQAGCKVCFVGTPCQCAALKSYVEIKKINTESLLLIDLICHGVPNQATFSKYLADKIEKDKIEIKEYIFKNKELINGKANCRTARLVSVSGESFFLSTQNDPFLKGYYGRLFYRPSCGKCMYARKERVADITIGDAWQVEDLISEWNCLEGVSLMLFNSEKGKTMFSGIENDMDIKEVTLEWAVKNNSLLNQPTDMHMGRHKFFELFDVCTFEEAVEMSMRVSLFKKVINKVNKLFYKKGLNRK